MSAEKFGLICRSCTNSFGSLRDWLFGPRTCSVCGDGHPFIVYSNLAERIQSTLFQQPPKHYPDPLFPVLPVEYATSLVPPPRTFASVESWPFLETLAARHGIECTVHAHRFDNIPATGTVKDLAGHLIASVCNEQRVRSAVVASTGNIAVALSRFLAQAGIHLFAFLPQGTSRLNVSEIACYGQTAFVVQGDYSEAKRVAQAAAHSRDTYFSPNGWDPIRIEAKKMIAYDWYTKLGRVPDVYVQALSGGMGPIGISKGIDELHHAGLISARPRLVLAQTDRCNPMAQAWAAATRANFPDGWEADYPILRNPDTFVHTISTGDPRLYPILGPLVRQSHGAIIDVPENALKLVAGHVARNAYVRIGPSSAVAVTGFLRALRCGHIRNGDEVVIAIGEGARRSPDFFSGVAEGIAIQAGSIPRLDRATGPELPPLDDVFSRI